MIEAAPTGTSISERLDAGAFLGRTRREIRLKRPACGRFRKIAPVQFFSDWAFRKSRSAWLDRNETASDFAPNAVFSIRLIRACRARQASSQATPGTPSVPAMPAAQTSLRAFSLQRRQRPSSPSGRFRRNPSAPGRSCCPS